MSLNLYLNIHIFTTLLITSIYDFKYLKIPKYIIEISIVFIFLLLTKNDIILGGIQVKDHLLASIVVFILMATISLLSQKIFKKTLLGFGDAKVAALGGAWLGIDGIQIAMSAAFIAAGFFSLIGRISQRLKPWQAFPFAPFICFSIQSVWILDKGQWLFL